MDLPSVFINNITQAFGDAGRRFLADLPDLVAEAARRWDLSVGEPFLLSYNYACAATLPDGAPAVLKIGVPNRELTSEMKTLRLYAGQGACRLFEADPERGMLLEERLLPGTMLADMADDDRATEIAADVMKMIRRPAPPPDGFLSLRGWFDELKKLRPLFNGGTGPFVEKSVGLVEELLVELFGEDRPQVLLHGDFHHFNILLSERGWLIIDPKGVIGPAEYEVGPLLLNPWGEMPGEAEAIRRTQRRIAILSERLEVERLRLWKWAVCHSLLSSWWDLPDPSSAPGADADSRRDYAGTWLEIFVKTKV
jgi:streptomycin 6-kinase